MKAFVVGATGEVGSQLVKQLVQNEQVSAVRMIVRRPVEQSGEKLEVCVVPDFAQIKENDLKGCQFGFSALGTIRDPANEAQLRIIDHDYPVHVAQMAKSAGCHYFGLVSSTGASPDSWFPELKLKAETEVDCTAAGPPCISIFRPAFLVCDRKNGSFGDTFQVRCVAPVLNFFAPGRYSVDTKVLAAFMIRNALVRVSKGDTGQQIYPNVEITRQQ